MGLKLRSSIISTHFMLFLSSFCSAQSPNSLVRATSLSTGNATWPADGNRLLFISIFSYKWKVHNKDLISGKETRPADYYDNDENPSCSPDGKKVLFSADKYGNQNL